MANKELWLVTVIDCGTGDILIGCSDSRKQANLLSKRMIEKLDAEDFSKSIKMVKKLNEIVLSFT